MSEWSSVEAGPDTIWHKHTTHNINYPVGRLPTIDCRITHEKPLIQTEKIKRANAFDTQSDELILSDSGCFATFKRAGV